MQVGAFIEGKLGEDMAKSALAVDQGARKAMRRITFGIRTGVRKRVRAGGFRKPKLESLIKAKVSGSGLDLNGVVRSVAVYRPGRFRSERVDLIELYSEGATVTAANGRWLAIPTGEGTQRGGRGGQRMATPAEMKEQGLDVRFVPATPRPVIVWRQRSGRQVVTHVLVRQVGLRSRYRIEDVLARWTQRYSAAMSDEINKAAKKLGLRDEQ